MLEYHKTAENKLIAELTDINVVVASGQDILDLIGDMYYNECNRLIIYDRNLHPDFFKLATGLAGDILQKFSNYRAKLAVIGDFSKYNSKSLHDFIGECNRGKMIFFVDTPEIAFEKLSKV